MLGISVKDAILHSLTRLHIQVILLLGKGCLTGSPWAAYHPTVTYPIALASIVTVRGSNLPLPLASAFCLAPEGRVEQHSTAHGARETVHGVLAGCGAVEEPIARGLRWIKGTYTCTESAAGRGREALACPVQQGAPVWSVKQRCALGPCGLHW